MFCFVNVFLYFVYIIVFLSLLPFGVINDNNKTIIIGPSIWLREPIRYRKRNNMITSNKNKYIC